MHAIQKLINHVGYTAGMIKIIGDEPAALQLIFSIAFQHLFFCHGDQLHMCTLVEVVLYNAEKIDLCLIDISLKCMAS